MSPVSTRALDALIAAGASAEQIAEFVKAEQVADEKRRAANRSYERMRKRAYRAANPRPECPAGHSGTFGDMPPSSLSSTSITTSVVGGVGVVVGAGAREQLVSQEAIALADDLYLIFGIDREFVPPGWCGLAMWLQAGLASGWQAPIVRIAANEVVLQLRRKQRPLPYSYKYLLEPINREHENAARPVPPAPEIPERQLPLVRSLDGRDRKASRPGGIMEALERRVAGRIDQREAGEGGIPPAESGPGGNGDAGGGRPLRIISK